ncbi:MAG: DUF3857 domain-containing protein [Cytophagales bacterium]|nr:DUF3857 domain-containing protein [Cytophagales bacterium]
MRYLLIFFQLLAFHLGAQHKSVKLTPAPAWVKQIEYPLQVADTSNAHGGYYDLLVDEQFNQSEKEGYYRYAQLIISEKGLSNVTPVSVSFDPSYQQLAFHSLFIIRNGKKLDQLAQHKIEVLRREQNLERAVYDGDLTAICNLQDLQIGDVLEYAYSIRGTNPVFGDKLFRTYYFNFGVPVKKVYYRLLLPANSHINQKSFNQAPEATVSTWGGLKEYEWQAQQVQALSMEEGAPAWYNPYQYVQLSEFNNWQEVATWANELFSLKNTSNLAARVPGLEADKPLEEKVARTIQFIQDEIRYLSFSDGIHGFKPHPPDQIISQRFGDCKDKSLLLSKILNELGIESNPVLINTSYGPVLTEVLPSPRMFDHCIVQFKLNDSTYWVDPTITFQRGSLKNLFLPDYRQGLVINAATSELTPIASRSKNGSIRVEEVFNVHEVGGAATLQVTSVYEGADADYIREYFKSKSLTDIDTQYLNFYATDYPEIELATAIEFTDDDALNRFTTREKYEIANFWEHDSTNEIQSASVYPRNLAGYLSTPSTKIRRMPYALNHPQHISYSIQLIMPEDWTITPAQKTIESAGFIYTSATTLKNGNEIYLDFTYQSKKKYLEKDEVKDHVKKVNDARGDMTFSVTYKHEGKTNKAFNTPFLLILLMLFIPGFFALKLMYEFDPEPKAASTHRAIGGWLILPAIGLSLTPFRMLYDFFQIEYFNYSNWRILTDPAYGAYNVELGIFILVEMIFNVALLFYSIVLVFLFFKRRSNVPILAAAFYGINFLFILLDAIAGSAYSEMDNETLRSIGRSMIAAAIWIPYFLISGRSKGTFTERNFEPVAPTNSSYL